MEDISFHAALIKTLKIWQWDLILVFHNGGSTLLQTNDLIYYWNSRTEQAGLDRNHISVG